MTGSASKGLARPGFARTAGGREALILLKTNNLMAGIYVGGRRAHSP